MSIWSNADIKVSRKLHRCIFCDKTIAKGEGYFSLVKIWEIFYYFRFSQVVWSFCKRCALLAETFELTERYEYYDDRRDIVYLKLRGLLETIYKHRLINCPVCGSDLYKCDISIDKESCICECKCGEKWSEDLSLEGIQKKIDTIKNSNPAAIKEG